MFKRGGASSFLEYVGLDASLDTMIEELTERYTKTAPADTLVCEFHQLQQEQNETIRQFAGRIEKLFKKLQIQLPDRYPDKTLMKDRLFYGMHKELKASLRYLFDRPETTYASLLAATHAAEVEYEKGKAMRARSKALAEKSTTLETPNSPLLSAMEDKIDKITSILKATKVKKDQKNAKKQQDTSATPEKKIDVTAKAGSGKKGFGGRCWKCGGWGHPMRDCPTQGEVQWDTVEKSKSQSRSPPQDSTQQ